MFTRVHIYLLFRESVSAQQSSRQDVLRLRERPAMEFPTVRGRARYGLKLGRRSTGAGRACWWVWSGVLLGLGGVRAEVRCRGWPMACNSDNDGCTGIVRVHRSKAVLAVARSKEERDRGKARRKATRLDERRWPTMVKGGRLGSLWSSERWWAESGKEIQREEKET